MSTKFDGGGWITSNVLNWAELSADEYQGLVEACEGYYADCGEAPGTVADVQMWIDAEKTPVVEGDAVTQKLAEPLVTAEQTAALEERKAVDMAEKARKQAELEAAQGAARDKLVKCARSAGKQLDKAEKAATHANVKAGRLCREGISAYLAVYPRGKKAAEDIVKGEITALTGQSYAVGDLVAMAGIADVFGDESIDLSLWKFRELRKLVELPEEGDGWVFLPGIEEGARKLVQRAVEGEAIPRDQWSADIMTLAGMGERNRAEALKQEAEEASKMAVAASGTAEGRKAEAEAIVAEKASEAAQKRAEMWQERLDKATSAAAESVIARHTPTQTQSVTSVAPPSQAKDIALTWIEELCRGSDKATRTALAIKLIGNDASILRDCVIQTADKLTVDQMVTIGVDLTDYEGFTRGLVRKMGEGDVPEIVDGIRGNDIVRKHVSKRFGGQRPVEANGELLTA